MAMNGDEEEFGWKPPSKAELKFIRAHSERQDQISRLMGDYLLKGYKMLGECCETCGTILLQDKRQKNYCVSCQELDSDVDKDNPALNAQAALSQVKERQLAAQSPVFLSQSLQLNALSSHASFSVPQPRPEHCEGAATGGRAVLTPPSIPAAPASTQLAPHPQPNATTQTALREAEEALLAKLRWATTQLQSSICLETSIQLCGLIGSCANSIRSLKEMSQ